MRAGEISDDEGYGAVAEPYRDDDAIDAAEDARQQAEIDAALAELQAELDKLDRRTLEIGITFRALREQRQALSDTMLSQRRRMQRGVHKASAGAMRDIRHAYRAKQAQQAQIQRAAPRRRYAPAKPKQPQRTVPQQQPVQQKRMLPPPPPQVIKVITQPPAPKPTTSKPDADVKSELQHLLANAGIDLPANEIGTIADTKPIQATEPIKPTAAVDARRVTP